MLNTTFPPDSGVPGMQKSPKLCADWKNAQTRPLSCLPCVGLSQSTAHTSIWGREDSPTRHSPFGFPHQCYHSMGGLVGSRQNNGLRMKMLLWLAPTSDSYMTKDKSFNLPLSCLYCMQNSPRTMRASTLPPGSILRTGERCYLGSD